MVAPSSSAKPGSESMASGIMRDMARRGKIIPFPRRPAEPEPPTGGRGFVEIHRCDQAEAVVVKSLLDSEGIPTLLRSRLAHSVHPFTVGDQGAVTILVPGREAFRSRRLLARIVRRSSSS